MRTLIGSSEASACVTYSSTLSQATLCAKVAESSSRAKASRLVRSRVRTAFPFFSKACSSDWSAVCDMIFFTSEISV